MNEAAQWRDLLHKKDREIEALHRQIDWLTQQLRRLNGRVYGCSSERSAELQEQLCLFEASSHETVRETPSEASVLCRRKKRCGKREADFFGLPVEQILHELPQEQRRCPQCGGELHACGHSVLRRELTYIPAQYKLTEHIQTAYSCRQCERAGTSVPMKKSTVPPALLPGSGIVSASLLAQIMNSKYVLALPLYRQEQELRRLGLPVSRQTMSNWVLTAGERWLLPVYHALHKELLANKILHADETTLMVLREPERQALEDELGEDGIRELAQRYAEAYEGCYDGDELDAYIEEICADAYAGMDRLPEAKTRIIQKAAKTAQDAQQAAEENGGTRGPPEKYSMVGYGSNGLKTYKSDFSSDMTATEKQEYLYSLIKSVWSKKPLQLTILQNGKERSISARFDGESNGQEFAGKMAFGNRRGTRTERLISLNLADDIWEIASESTYDASKGGIKETLAHDGSERWHYFVNAINYVDEQQPSRNGVYDFNLDVMEREDGNFVYTFALKKRRDNAPRTFAAGVNGNNAADANSSDTSIRSAEQKSQEKFSAAEDVSESDAGAEGTTAFTLDSIPKKAQDYLRRVRGQTAAAIQQTLSMPFAARQEVLKPAIEEMMNEYLQTGRISQETVDRSFEESYRRGVKRPTVRVRWEFSDTP